MRVVASSADATEKLGAYNSGKTLPGVVVTRQDGSKVIGLLRRRTDESVHILEPQKILANIIPTTDISSIQTVPPYGAPPCTYAEHHIVIGGVGKQKRRSTYPNSEPGSVGAFVAHAPQCQDSLWREKLDRVCSSIRGIVIHDAVEDYDIVACVIEGPLLANIVMALAHHGFVVTCPNVKRASIAADSYNRSPHMYSQQLKFVPLHKVGPTRGLWRFRGYHLPQHWESIPFSWPALAKFVVKDLISNNEQHRVHELELPLRWYVCKQLERTLAQAHRKRLRKATQRETEYKATRAALRVAERALAVLCAKSTCVTIRCGAAKRQTRIEKVQMCIMKRSDLRRRMRTLELEIESYMLDMIPILPKKNVQKTTYHVLHPMSEEQSDDGIEAFHVLYYGAEQLSDDQRKVAMAKLFHWPMLTGFFFHWFSSYCATGNHVGNGTFLRYDIDMQSTPTSVLNKIEMCEDGELRGKGHKGYKGIFNRDGRYDPKRQLVRTPMYERSMLFAPSRVGLADTHQETKTDLANHSEIIRS
mgnify:CR=1 FL=1|tara:strand:+ start:2578 stop:4167 length:1590 start_codon:yes stop_codon:yes gene_type:complete